ncbi:helix-turn-helix domain-containing protein [Arthrobacter sp. 7Tela_A1]|uniref:helix-turn-helix domain-containing protein n=1 Tax=Arthrobacter sp. 7Tela_A1 TaxID=3093745 RepID=UPI003BB5C520
MWWYVHTMRRPITNTSQLGTAVHDARKRAGMTQAVLAARAGVSRKWLIGLEQGARTGAELGKVFDVLRALNLSITLGPLIEATQSGAVETSSNSNANFGPIHSPAGGTSTNSATLNNLRRSTQPSAEVAEILRRVTSSNSATLNNLRRSTQPSAEVAEILRRTRPPQAAKPDEQENGK